MLKDAPLFPHKDGPCKQFASSIVIVMTNICAFHAYAKQQVTERVLHLLTGPEKPCTWNTQTQV